MSHLETLRIRLLRLTRQRKQFAESARTAGLTLTEARAALNAETAAFSNELADAWQLSDSLLRQIQEMLVGAIEAGVFETNFDLRSRDHVREFKKLKHEEVLEWLKRNDYVAQVGEVTLKSIVRAVAIDLVEFATEALRCTIRGPLTVAIALFRKPFKENLLVLEWILGDPADYFERFFSGDATKLSLSAVPPPRKLEIIRAAMAETVYQEFIPAEFIYSLRYDKQSNLGFELLWQHANHLITTQGNLKTEAENLNFVFSTADDRDTQWRAFYTMAPIFFFHTLEILEAVIKYFASFRGGVWGIMRLRTLAGMYLWMRSPGCIWSLPVEKPLGKVVRGFLRSVTCSCGKRVSWREANIRTFFLESKVRCFACGETIEIDAADESSEVDASA